MILLILYQIYNDIIKIKFIIENESNINVDNQKKNSTPPTKGGLSENLL
jgi:hypothetical protein